MCLRPCEAAVHSLDAGGAFHTKPELRRSLCCRGSGRTQPSVPGPVCPRSRLSPVPSLPVPSLPVPCSSCLLGRGAAPPLRLSVLFACLCVSLRVFACLCVSLRVFACLCVRLRGCSGNVARGDEHEHVGHAHTGRSPESGLRPDHPGPSAERPAGGALGHVPVHPLGPRLAQLVCVPVFRGGCSLVLRGAACLLLHPHLQPQHSDALHQLPPDGVLPLLRGDRAGAHRVHRRSRESCGRFGAGHCHGVRVPDLVPDDRLSVDHVQRVLRRPPDRSHRLNLKNEELGSFWTSRSNSAEKRPDPAPDWARPKGDGQSESNTNVS